MSYGGPHGASAHNFAYGHRPAYHGGWYHGDWGGHWAHPWGFRPAGWYWGGGWGWGWGLGFGFGLGTGLAMGVTYGSPWGWGYYPYYNPYWVPPVNSVTYINYGQPIVVAPPATAYPRRARVRGTGCVLSFAEQSQRAADTGPTRRSFGAACGTATG